MALTGNLPVHRPETDRISVITPDHPAIIDILPGFPAPFPVRPFTFTPRPPAV
jgi:hypothetical protein